MSYLINPMAGEIGRLKWWLSQLLIIAILIVGVVTIVAMNMDVDANSVDQIPDIKGMMWPLMIFTGYINFCACLNRLRDTGRSGWWYLAHFIPLAGPFIICYFCGISKGDGGSSYSGGYDGSSSIDADEIIRRYQAGESAAAHMPVPAPKPRRPQPAAPQGFGKRKGFQGIWT